MMAAWKPGSFPTLINSARGTRGGSSATEGKAPIREPSAWWTVARGIASFFLCILLINCLRFWDATRMEEVLAKILVTFISGMFLVTKMQTAYNKARVEDGNDQAN